MDKLFLLINLIDSSLSDDVLRDLVMENVTICSQGCNFYIVPLRFT
jgi:hypothetical protein